MALDTKSFKKPAQLSIRRLSKVCGVQARNLQRLMARSSWDDIKIGTVSKILDGCGKLGANIFDDSKVAEFAAKYADSGFTHLTKNQRRKLYRTMGWKLPV